MCEKNIFLPELPLFFIVSEKWIMP
jgi:hypothetical protein